MADSPTIPPEYTPAQVVHQTRCPRCFAAGAARVLLDEQRAGTGADVRAGMGLGYLEVIAESERGWRFCDEHAPKGEPNHGH